MGLVLDGIRSLVQAAAATVAQLVGQDVAVRSLTATNGVTSNATVVAGTSVAAATTLNVGGNVVLSKNQLAVQDTDYQSNVTNGATAVAHAFYSIADLTTAGAQVAAFWKDNFSTKVFAVDQAGKIVYPQAGNSTGSPGAATLNTSAGRSAIAAGASSVVITNSLVSATSIVWAVVQTTDGTLLRVDRVVPGVGSFTIIGNANATGNVNVGWVVVN
jgi:hypothetical protein